MKVIGAYLLAVLGGNATPSAGDIRNTLGSVGIEADDDKLELLLSQVKGKDINELIAAGQEKLASVPTSGAAAATPPSASDGGAAVPAPAAEGKKKEEIFEEKEESDGEMMFSLFD